jgi:hypothetical protein
MRSVPELCRRIAELDVLADLARRRNSNLGAINSGRGTDSVPGHHVFKHLQAVNFEFWFQLVPIPARRYCLVRCSAGRSTTGYNAFPK